MAATGSLTQRQRQLANALAQAKNAAKAAEPGDDGGSANFDSVVLLAKRGLTAKVVDPALAAAGVTATRRRGDMWSGWFLHLGSGIGARNTRMIEAAYRALTEAGEAASPYYRVD